MAAQDGEGFWLGARVLVLLCVRGSLMWLYVPLGALAGLLAYAGKMTLLRRGAGPRAYVRSADNLVTQCVGRALGLSTEPMLVAPSRAHTLSATRLTDAW